MGDHSAASILMSYLATSRAMPTDNAAFSFMISGISSIPGIVGARFFGPEDFDKIPSETASTYSPLQETFYVRFQGRKLAILIIDFSESPSPRLMGDLANTCNMLALELIRRETEAELQLKVEERTKDLRRMLDEAEKRDQTRVAFLANISHELRTPVNALCGFLGIMENKLYGPIGNKQYEEYVTLLLSASNHLRELVDELLLLSAVSVDEKPLVLNTLSPTELIDKAVKLKILQADDNQLRLTHIRAKDTPYIHVDEGAFIKALTNVIGNAVKFTPAEGNVVIEERYDVDRDIVQIIVTDEGPGISDEEVARLLKPFEQSHQVRHEQAGFGLGLPITALIMQRHNGNLKFGRAPDGRFQVTLEFPASLTSAEAEPKKQKIS